MIVCEREREREERNMLGLKGRGEMRKREEGEIVDAVQERIKDKVEK